MTRLNKITCANCPSNRFITFFFCVLDPASGVLTFANAGHNPPLVVHPDGTIEWLGEGGLVLGIVPFATYSECKYQLQKGDVLVLYSDGVTEAINPQDEDFGEARFAEVVKRHRCEPAARIVEAITAELTAFGAGRPAADDITLEVARLV
jgi:sigma-B regulation protein RsbU (phosphoserine phosphatase)